jgi:DNA polymerase
VALHLDFETFSPQDLKVVGSFRYAEDPLTEALILGWAIGDMDPIAVDLTRPWEEVKADLAPVFGAIAKGMTVCAHNAHFERNIIEVVCRHWPIKPQPWQWDCTAARARMIAIPGSLEGATHALGVPAQKDKRGDELIKIFSKLNKGKRTYPHERPEDFKAFMDYCAQDVRVEVQLDKILPPLPDVEARAFALDYKINRAGMPVNLERVKAADGFIEEYSEELTKRAISISGYRPTQRERTLEYLESRGYELPNLQAGTVEALAADDTLPGDLRELLDHRIELSRAGTKKLKAIQNCVSDDGRIRGGFLFSAASTRRWSSTGVQMHNLQKPEGETNPEVAMSLLDCDPDALRVIFNRPLTVLAQSVRGFFESHDDHFLVADYSSIEPRGLAWSANEHWMLEAYRQRQDAYKIAAGRVYGITPSQVDGSQRFMGKQLVLGCGYGMGPPKFQGTCARFGRQISEAEAIEAVYGYRNSVPAITTFWKDVERACIRAVRKWAPVECGRFTMRPETLANGFQVLFVDMPSGTIAYPKPSIGQEEWAGEMRPVFEFWTPWGSSWIQTDTFGGSLTENIIQALTRDVLRDGMLGADDAGFDLIGHVHDEAIAEGDDDPDALREFEHVLCGSSPWAEGLPIEMEGYIAKAYRK